MLLPVTLHGERLSGASLSEGPQHFVTTSPFRTEHVDASGLSAHTRTRLRYPEALTGHLSDAQTYTSTRTSERSSHAQHLSEALTVTRTTFGSIPNTFLKSFFVNASQLRESSRLSRLRSTVSRATLRSSCETKSARQASYAKTLAKLRSSLAKLSACEAILRNVFAAQDVSPSASSCEATWPRRASAHTDTQPHRAMTGVGV